MPPYSSFASLLARTANSDSDESCKTASFGSFWFILVHSGSFRWSFVLLQALAYREYYIC